MGDFKILAFQNTELQNLAEYNIFVHFKISAFQHPEFNVSADFKILAFQNPQFKGLGDFNILAYVIRNSRFWHISRFSLIARF